MKYEVTYTVTYIAEVTVDDGESLDDAITDICIPEGGDNHSVYVKNSFETLRVLQTDEEVVK